MTTRELKTLSFDNGLTVYQVNDTVARNGLTTKLDIAQPMTTLATSGTITLADNTVYKMSASDTVTFTLPTVTDLTKFHQILVQLYMATAQTIDLGTTDYFGGEAPDMSEEGYYTIIWEYDNIADTWVVGAMKKGSEE